MKKMIGLILALMLITVGAALGEETEADMNRQEVGQPLTMKIKRSHKRKGENNPLYTQRFGADPGVMEYDGRLYVFMTNDTLEFDANNNVKENSYSQIRHISCISSDDLVNWTDHGLIPVAGNTGIAQWAGNSWAPCAAHKTIDGKEQFFLYYCNGGNGIGVLTADSPTGPWRDPLGKALVSRSTPNCANVTWLFDPAVMVDEDGTGYLAFGGGVPEGMQKAPGTGRIVRLGADMISLDGEPQTLDVPWLFEDSGLNKINGIYYYTYCSNWQTDGNPLQLTSGAIQYMTSDNPMGPYTYGGELFPNEGRFFGLYGNNHHSVAEFNGHWYLFYHNRPVEKDMGITGNYRSPQIDEIFFSDSGRVKQVKGTMAGVAQLKPLDPYQEVSACTLANQAGTQTLTQEDTNRVRGEAGSWTKAAGADFGAGCKEITLKLGAEEEAALYILLGGLATPVAARVDIPAGTADGSEFTVPLQAEGVQDIYFVMDGTVTFESWTVK